MTGTDAPASILRPALASTLHDPDGRLLPVLRAHALPLAAYASIHIIASPPTDPTLTDALRSAGAEVRTTSDGRIGQSRRDAVAAARARGSANILYCDFDRWLHWAACFPAELAAVPARIAAHRPPPWYVCLGRTARAFATHPRVQRDTERATNHALSLALGRRLDATAGACWLSREGADIVLRDSRESTLATDLEWPVLIHRVAPDRLGRLALEGLEFETADRYPREIEEAGGLERWMERHYETPEVWRHRLRLAADSVSALCCALGA